MVASFRLNVSAPRRQRKRGALGLRSGEVPIEMETHECADFQPPSAIGALDLTASQFQR
jgi:hypothetical protein